MASFDHSKFGNENVLPTKWQLTEVVNSGKLDHEVKSGNIFFSDYRNISAYFIFNFLQE